VEFKTFDQVLPKKKCEKGKDRVKDIETALDWCRKKEVKSSGVDEDSPTFNNIANEIEDASDWMRNDGVSLDVPDRLPAFSQIETIPVSRRAPHERKKDAADLLSWIRLQPD
jgi:hypothetical protein